MANKSDKRPVGDKKKVTGIILFLIGLMAIPLCIWPTHDPWYYERYAVEHFLHIAGFIFLILALVGIILFFQGKFEERKQLSDDAKVQHTNRIAKASLVLGIIGVLPPIALYLGSLQGWLDSQLLLTIIPIVAIVLAVVNIRYGSKQGIKSPPAAKAGLVLGIVGATHLLLLFLLIFIFATGH